MLPKKKLLTKSDIKNRNLLTTYQIRVDSMQLFAKLIKIKIIKKNHVDIEY